MIYILSPQPWSNFHVSKHHYAIELSKRGNEVYFISRGQGGSGAISIEKIDDYGLSHVSYESILSKKLRFHLPGLYSFLHNFQLKRVMKKIGKQADVVWCFEPLIYKDLSIFNAKLTIFHPVDLMEVEFLETTPYSADIIFSVADNILEKFKDISVPSYFINHGLAYYFSEQDMLPYSKGNKMKFAYIGNICMHGIDHDSLIKIIQEHKGIDFHFYGPTTTTKRITQESIDFIQFLKDASNVVLHGVVDPKTLAMVLRDFDGYLLCYRSDLQINAGSNSHKVLEYLSFGRLLVSSYISHYSGREEIQMARRMDNSDYVDVFRDSVANIEELNSLDSMQKRRALALENTYSRQLDKIESYLAKI